MEAIPTSSQQAAAGGLALDPDVLQGLFGSLSPIDFFRYQIVCKQFQEIAAKALKEWNWDLNPEEQQRNGSPRPVFPPPTSQLPTERAWFNQLVHSGKSFTHRIEKLRAQRVYYVQVGELVLRSRETLTHLSVTAGAINSFQPFRYIIPCAVPNLTVLQLRRASRLDNKGLLDVLQRCPNLRHLDMLYSRPSLSFSTVHQLTRLETLCLFHTPFPTDAPQLPEYLKPLTSLKNLVIESLVKIDPQKPAADNLARLWRIAPAQIGPNLRFAVNSNESLDIVALWMLHNKQPLDSVLFAQLLSQGYKPTGTDPLLFSLRRNAIQPRTIPPWLLQAFVSNGADLYYQDANGDNGFTYSLKYLRSSDALQNWEETVIKPALKTRKITEIFPPRADGQTVLHTIVKHTKDTRRKIRYLLHLLNPAVLVGVFGVERFQTDAKGRTAMHYAKSETLVDVLRNAGFGLLAKDHAGKTPLDFFMFVPRLLKRNIYEHFSKATEVTLSQFETLCKNELELSQASPYSTKGFGAILKAAAKSAPADEFAACLARCIVYLVEKTGKISHSTTALRYLTAADPDVKVLIKRALATQIAWVPPNSRKEVRSPPLHLAAAMAQRCRSIDYVFGSLVELGADRTMVDSEGRAAVFYLTNSKAFHNLWIDGCPTHDAAGTPLVFYLLQGPYLVNRGSTATPVNTARDAQGRTVLMAWVLNPVSLTALRQAANLLRNKQVVPADFAKLRDSSGLTSLGLALRHFDLRRKVDQRRLKYAIKLDAVVWERENGLTPYEVCAKFGKGVPGLASGLEDWLRRPISDPSF